MNRIISVVLALAGALSAAACSSSSGPDRRPRRAGFEGGLFAAPIGLAMTDFDADGDRSILRAELDAALGPAFAELDANGDGEASAFEFSDWARAVLGAETAIPGRVAFDRNAGGTISGAEFATTLTAEFARLDADGDGAVERAELVRMVEPEAVNMEDGRRRVIMQGPNGPEAPQGPDGAVE